MDEIPLQQRIPPAYDHLFHQMRAAYEGDTETWVAVNIAMRDAIVDYAVGRSPYYRRTIPPGARFEDIPILTKQDLRGNVPELLAEGVPEARRVAQTTSGSTGERISFFRDTAQQLAENVSSDRFFRWLHGVPFDAAIVGVMSTVHPTRRMTRRAALVRRLQAIAGRPSPAEWLYPVPMADVRPEDAQRHLDEWSRLGPYFMIGHASGIDWFADRIERHGLRLRRAPLAVAASGDTVTPQLRGRIGRVFGCPVHARYGAAELPWLAVSQPGHPDRYLFNPILGHVEIVDRDGRPSKPGEAGRVILTDLHNRVMPLIRYDVGDLAVASFEGWVGGFRLIGSIEGRESDLLVLPSGKALGSSSLSQYLAKRHDFGEWIRFFQCAQVGPNALELRVVWDGDPPEAERRRLIAAVRDITDPDTAITIRDVEELERLPSGKAWVVRREDRRA